MSCLPIVSDSCDRREQVFRVGAAAPRVFKSKYLLICHTPLPSALCSACATISYLLEV